MRIEKLAQNYSIKLKYTLFPLHPYVPDEGMTLEELFKGRNIDISAAQEHLKNIAQGEGLEMGERRKTYNSRLAQELGKWADTQEGKSEIHSALYRAYFVDGINLADVDSLVKIAESIQLDGAKARKILEERKYQSLIDEDWQRCRILKIMAVPTYICNDERLVGAQTYEAMEGLVKSQGATVKLD